MPYFFSKNYIRWLTSLSEDVCDSDGVKVEVIDILEMVNKNGGLEETFKLMDCELYMRDRLQWMQDPFKFWLTKGEAKQKEIETKIAQLSNPSEVLNG